MFQFRSGTNQVQPTLFDIRIQTQHKNVFMIKGSPLEAPPVLLNGHVVISLPDDLHIKNISLNLVGTYKLDFLETYKDTGNSSTVNAVKAESVVFKVDWNNLLRSKEGTIVKGDYGQRMNSGLDVDSNLNRVNMALNELLLTQDSAENTKTSTTTSSSSNNHSTASLSHLISSKSSKSSSSNLSAPILEFNDSIKTRETPFPNIKDGINYTYKLPKGNYSLPFEILLPGNIPETIEGLQCGAVLYRFESRIETVKSSTKHPLVAYKYIRIFRSPAPTDIVLNEDCSIENNWPNKIQYEVRIPRKAVPIGAKTKVHIFIVPLVKNMKLGKISATIHQFFYLRGPKNESFEDDKVIYKCELPEVSMDELSRDKWSLEAKILIPSKLKQCSPDCTLRDDLIKIRHKLVLTINLINPDGHTSQVKSKLPIVFYISPNERVIGRNAYVDVHGRVRFKTGHKDIFNEASGKDDNTRESTSSASGTDNRNNSTGSQAEEIHVDRDYEIGNDLNPEDNENGEEEEFLPSYKDSERDILFTPDMLSPSGYLSPAIRSGTQTPSYFDFEPARPNDGNTEQEGYFPPSGMASPAFQFLSRVNSSSNLTSGLHGMLTPSANTALLDSSKLSEIPDYNNVYDLDYEDQDEPAPLYYVSDLTTPPSYLHLKHSGSRTPQPSAHSKSLPNHLDTHGGDRELADYLVSRILDSQRNRSTEATQTTDSDNNTTINANDSNTKPIPISSNNKNSNSNNASTNTSSENGSGSGSSISNSSGVGAFGMSPSTKITRPTLSLGRHSTSSLRNLTSFIGSNNSNANNNHGQLSSSGTISAGTGISIPPSSSKSKSNSANRNHSSTSLFRLSSSHNSRNNSHVNLNSIPGNGTSAANNTTTNSHSINELRETPSPPPAAHQHSRSPTSLNFTRH